MSIGMLRFREPGGIIRGVEASRVSEIRSYLAPLEGGVITRICLERPGEYVDSIDNAEDLMDEHEEMVAAARPIILLREDPMDMIRKVADGITRRPPPK